MRPKGAIENSRTKVAEPNPLASSFTCCAIGDKRPSIALVFLNRLLGGFNGAVNLGAFGIKIICYTSLLIQRRLRDKTDCKIFVFYRFSLANALSKRVQVIDESSAFK